MATNEAYKRGWQIPLTVGASVAARTPVCVGKIAGVTLTPTGSSGTQVATVLRHGVANLLVDSACDAVTLTGASVTNTQTLIINAMTYTAVTSTTTWSTRSYSIAGADSADMVLLCKAINGGPYVTLASAAVADWVKVTANGVTLTFTAHASTTTAANREFSIAGTDAQDAAELVTVLNDATYGIAPYVATQGAATGEVIIQPPTTYPCASYPAAVVTTSNGTRLAVAALAPLKDCIATVATNVVTIKSSEVISAVTGTASGATVTVDHAQTSTKPVFVGDSVYWTTPSTLNCKAETGTAFFGRVTQAGGIQNRKLTLASVTDGQTIVINGVTFTAKTSTTTLSSRFFSIAGTDAQDAALLVANINDANYGVNGVVATDATAGVITFASSRDITVTGTAVVAGTCAVAAGSRTVNVKLGY
jgi:hypothetical protein